MKNRFFLILAVSCVSLQAESMDLHTDMIARGNGKQKTYKVNITVDE